MVIITTDHGNANPGVIYGKYANKQFDSIQEYKHTNDWILNGFGKETSISQVKQRIEYANNIVVTTEEAQVLLGYYNNLNTEKGLYNPKKLHPKKL